jgi:hypothetical protein
MNEYSKLIYDLAKDLGIEDSSSVELNNLGLLISAQKDEDFDKFVADLRACLVHLKADYKTDKLLLCLLVLCCEGYSINHKNVPMYTNNEIHALVWRAISSCVFCRTVDRQYVPELLIDGRNS